MNLFDRSVSRSQKRLLGLIILVALVGQGLTAYGTAVIGTDSINFLEMADRMHPLRLDLVEGVNHHEFHPFYPLLLALARDLTGLGPVEAGQAVSVLFGTLSLLPLFFIARHLFGTVPALCTAALFAVNPEALENSGDVMSEATFLFFVLASVALAIPTITRRSPLGAAFSGAAAGLAYLTRPEGGTPMLVLAVVLLMAMRKERRAAGRALALALLAFAVVAAPYILHISFIDGTFKPEITLKKPLWSHKPFGRQRQGVDRPIAAKADPEEAKKADPLFVKLGHEYGESVFYFALPFVLIGAGLSLSKRRSLGQGTRFVVLVMGLIVAVAILLFYAVGYLSSRHILGFTTLTLVWGGYGLAFSALWLRQKAGWQRLTEAGSVALLCGLIVAAHLPKVAKSNRVDFRGVKQVGEFVKAQALKPDEFIITNSTRVIYYAGLADRNRITIGRSKRLDDAEIKRVQAKTGGRVRMLVVLYKDDFKAFIDSGEYGEAAFVFRDDTLKKKRWFYVFPILRQETK